MALNLGSLLLPAAGLGLASSAAAFAFVMITDGDRTPRFSGIDHLRIFAQPSTGSGARTAQRAPAARPPAALDADPATVGSIKPRPGRGAAGGGDAQRAETHVRGLFEGKALVEVPSGFALVEPGARQPQVGETLSIVSRNGKWVIVDAEDRPDRARSPRPLRAASRRARTRSRRRSRGRSRSR